MVRRKWLMGALILGALLLLSAPTIVSRMGIARNMLLRVSGANGISIDAQTISIGWFSPLRLRKVIIGQDTDENHFFVSRVDTDLTVFDLLGAGRSKSRDWVLNSVRINTIVEDGQCPLVDDLNRLLKTDRLGSSIPHGKLQIYDIGVEVTDTDSGDHWELANAHVELGWEPRAVNAELKCDIADPGNSSGSIEVAWHVKVDIASINQQRDDHEAVAGVGFPTVVRDWELELIATTVPISTVTLAVSFLGDAETVFDSRSSGSISGALRFSGDDKGTLTGTVDDLSVGASSWTGFGDGQQPDARLTTEVFGNIDGHFLLTRNEGSVRIESQLAGTDVAFSKMFTRNSESNSESQAIAGTLKALKKKLVRGEVEWVEPRLNITVDALYDFDDGHVALDSVQVASDLGTARLSGVAKWGSRLDGLMLNGNAKLQMQEVASRLQALTGTNVKFSGEHQTPLSIEMKRSPTGAIEVDADGRIGWQTGEIAAMKLGPASVPFRLDDTEVYITPTQVPIGDGQLNLGGKIKYHPEPLSLHLPRGELVRGVKITPEITERWLRFIAPPAANVRAVDGKFDLEIDEGRFVPGDPLQHRVTGRVRVQGAELTMSPMIQEVMVATRSKAARAMSRPFQNASGTNVPRVHLPPQTIEFDLAEGAMLNKKLVVEVGGMPIPIRGYVSLDSHLNMIARVPLDSLWLRPQLRGEPGEFFDLPIHGTIFYPEVDRQRVGRLVSKIVRRTVARSFDRSVSFNRELSSLLLENTRKLRQASERFLDGSEHLVKPFTELKDNRN